MKHVLIVLLPILFVGSVMGGEPERKARVQSLVKQLADESLERRQTAYSELRDTFVRKRDVSVLNKEIARGFNPEVSVSLQELITFISERWRLPDKGWTSDIRECDRAYSEKFKDLGCFALIGEVGDSGPKPIVGLDLLDFPPAAESRANVIGLILTLEPEALKLHGAWTDITFLNTLSNLERLALEDTHVSNLSPLKELLKLRWLIVQNAELTDLTPLKGLLDLESLYLGGTGVSDLTPLEGLPNLRVLDLRDTKVTDLTPLKRQPSLNRLSIGGTEVLDLTPLEGLPNLWSLNLENTKVTDLTPLKDLQSLSDLNLEKTKVTDLAPLKGLPRLRSLSLLDTRATDLTPLEGLPSLRYLYLQNTGGVDLAPLEGMSVFVKSESRGGR